MSSEPTHAPAGAAGNPSLFPESESVERPDVVFKALSLWQPHATAIMLGIKPYETRGWPTGYRGPLLVCAAKKKFSASDYDPDYYREVDIRLRHAGCSIYSLRYGEAICIVDLVDCVSTEKLATLAPGHRFWGDFSPGRFAFQLERPRKIWPPVRVTGRQGWWDQAIPSTNNALKVHP